MSSTNTHRTVCCEHKIMQDFVCLKGKADTRHTGVGQHTDAFVSSHIIDAGALVQARVGGTLVDVSLAVRPYMGEIRHHTRVRNCPHNNTLCEQT